MTWTLASPSATTMPTAVCAWKEARRAACSRCRSIWIRGCLCSRLFAPAGQDWTRQELAESFGKYRRTTARVRAGDGRAKAAFTARLPRAGRWRIDYHLPDPSGDASSSFAGSVRQGAYRFEVVAAGVSTAVEFDADAAEWGWNDLGSFDLPGGEVALVVSNATTGAAVFADAVRWRSAD